MNTLVTADEVEKAAEQESEDYEAAGIAQDIDTQWGMMPQGGALKESNHFYGPGRYDYY